MKFFIKWMEDLTTGEQGFAISSPTKKLPAYFQPTLSIDLLVHDMVDHVKYNPNIHPIMDEVIALGASWYRGGPSADAIAVSIYSFIEDVYEDALYQGVNLDINTFKINFRQKEDKDSYISTDILAKLNTKLYTVSNSNEFKEFASKYFPLKAITACLNRGYSLAEKFYCGKSWLIYENLLYNLSNYKGKDAASAYLPEEKDIIYRVDIYPESGYVETKKRYIWERAYHD